MGSLRQALSLILSGLVLFSQALAQAQTPASPPKQAPSQKVHPDLKRARRAAERGEKAESIGRLDEALRAYEEAARYVPRDMAYATRVAGLQSKLVRSYADAAERDALASRFDQATEDLGAALAIDPANAIVLERLREIKSMGNETGPRVAAAIPGLPQLKPQAGKRSLDLRGDTKTVYEQLASIFGLRVTFDPDLIVRNVRLNIEDVDFQNAVKVLAAQTGTFWRPVNAALMFVAADTPEKRRQFDLQAEQTFPLSSAISSEDATEVLRILREITGAPHIDLDTRTHSITMRDTPERLALTGALIQQMERARGELMLEIELLEVDKNTARKLGVEPPTSHRLIALPPNLLSQLTQAGNVTALQTLLAGIFGSAVSGGSSSVSSLIPPIVAVGGGKTTFLLTLPSAAVDFSDALSLVQSGRQVLLRAQDGKPATFFVGQRFPITLSLLSGSVGTTAFTPNPGGASNPFPSTSFAAGKGPASLVAADFLNNGSLDIAAVNEIDNSVTLLLNQNSSQGTFAEATGSPISLGSARAAAPATHPGIASATFTNSGCHDLVVSDPLANQVDVLLSNCDGTFQKPVAIPAGSNPTAVATGDFNGDGKQDFAVVNQNDNSVSIFLGDGTGKFTAATGSPFVPARQLVITSTSLLDGVLNSAYNATLQSIGGIGAVTWSLTTGTLPAGLTLNPSTGAITGTPTAAGTSAITVNAIDSASPPNSATIAVSITVNTSAPAFAISTASLPNGTIGVPYDQILTATGGTAPFTWTVSSGSLPAGLTLSPTGEITGTPTSTATTPPSFTFTVTTTDSSATPLTAQKQFTLTPIPATAAARGPVAIVQHDFNADGNQDLAIVNQATNNVTILLGKGDGTFTEATGSPISSGNGPVAIAAGDLNGDSKPDLAVVNQTDNTVSVLLNNGDATFAASASSPLQTGAGTSPNGVAIADFNQDGLADIAVTNSGANSFSVFAGISAGLFSLAFQPPAGPTGSTPTAIIAGTFATGGFPDVAITNDVPGAAGDVTVILSPASLFANGVARGVQQQPYPGSEYVDLGVKIKATPTLHSNSEVTLQLEFEIRALAGSAVNGIPVLSNRTLSQTVRVKENEPTLITGMTDTEETRSIAGLPGFAEVPTLRYAFSSKSHTFQDTELLIVITPRRLRLADHLTRTLYAGRGDVGRGGAGAGFRGTPTPTPPQPQPQPEPPLQQPQPRPEQPQQQPPQPQQPKQQPGTHR
ncbi:MAG TPA: FG-GAP-like repeat-containing protein [Candidatus Acidoferrum sp.]|nr:FG-GAP-like repeat-containing protein [Candidatus Acidoferrum sp.]